MWTVEPLKMCGERTMSQLDLSELLESANETVTELNDLVKRLIDAEGAEKSAFTKYLMPLMAKFEEQVALLTSAAPDDEHVQWYRGAVYAFRSEIAFNAFLGSTTWLNAKSRGSFGFFGKMKATSVWNECLKNLDCAIALHDDDYWRLRRAWVLFSLNRFDDAIGELQHIMNNKDGQHYQVAREMLFEIEKAKARGFRW
jgi:hypothetical protein